MFIAVGVVCIAFILFYEFYRVQRYKGEKKKMYRYREWWIVSVIFYVFTILCATYLGREVSESEVQWRLFWTLKAAWMTGEWKYWYFIIGNILLFVPLGFLLCHLFRRKWQYGWSILLCLLFSCIIEMIQYFTGTGLCELDDVFHNTLGGGVGVFLHWVTKRREKFDSCDP